MHKHAKSGLAKLRLIKLKYTWHSFLDLSPVIHNAFYYYGYANKYCKSPGNGLPGVLPWNSETKADNKSEGNWDGKSEWWEIFKIIVKDENNFVTES